MRRLHSAFGNQEVHAGIAWNKVLRSDWRHYGSCWTFSTTGALESHLALKAGAWRAPRLSEQQLVDCAGAFDTQGCNGGLPSHAFEYIKHAGGLSTEFSYPYHAKDQKCTFNASASTTAPQSACCVDSTRHDAIDTTPSTPWRSAESARNRLHILKSFLQLVKQCLTHNLHHVQLILCHA